MRREQEFRKEDFMSYLSDTFEGFNNSFLRDTVENLIDYAMENQNTRKGQLVYFLCKILPELELGEIALFEHDENLTKELRLEKLSCKGLDGKFIYRYKR